MVFRHFLLPSMHGTFSVKDLSDDLDLLGQHSSSLFRLYTQLCFCFSLADTSSHSAIIDTLTHGLERLYASFPWLAGEVVNQDSGQGSPGIFKIRPLDRFPRLEVKDSRLDPSIPTMDALRRANFPFSMLDENIIAPRKTLPGSAAESASDSDSALVFILQANFVVGGLLLTVVAQHNAMDMTGQGQIIHLLSKACRNEQFTSEELLSGNLARGNLIPLLDDSYRPGSELAYQIVKSSPSHPISNSTDGSLAPALPPKCTWTYFTFSPSSLTALKSLAMATIAHPSRYITTDDALSAFIWQSVVRARLHRLNPAAESTFARAVDVRRHLNIPQTYPGLMQNMTYHTSTLKKLLDEPLGGIASQLRWAVDPKTSNLGYSTRALATFLDRAPDKQSISFTATLDLSVDIALSSWAKLDCYELDFNLGLGKPAAVRRPQFDPVESLIYLMPRALDGEIAVGMCLRDEDMKRLRADGEFAKYGKHIG